MYSKVCGCALFIPSILILNGSYETNFFYHICNNVLCINFVHKGDIHGYSIIRSEIRNF